MKRQLLFSGIIASLLLSSCVKSLEDEGITINNVTHFSYGGYNYQVHHDLGQMSWHAAQDACDNLVAYGYDDWFMPSMGEMQAARDAGLTWVLGWTSTYYGQNMVNMYYYYPNNASSFYSSEESSHHSICPMRKE